MSHEGSSWSEAEFVAADAVRAVAALSPNTSAARLLISDSLTFAVSEVIAVVEARTESRRESVSPSETTLALPAPRVEAEGVAGTGLTTGAGAWAQAANAAA